ncbi:CPBP family intramembrane glutamic endopeptidase [Gordonia shandongensis]|uniref:CPBP family intramembrane glutamic endopeptidase n=1 Tax=Gordonia shandongensis TaxID=376351 RepID=UPI00047EF252|nr:CPBP family intramembrane glutamic endopeptidase [Gordonia shandongensis]
MTSRADPPGADIVRIDDPTERRALIVELVIVGVLTFGFKAIGAALSLLQWALTGGLGDVSVALNPSRSPVAAIDAVRQAMGAATLVAFGLLALYLLWRTGIGPRALGLGRPRRADAAPSLVLAAVIGLPGLGLVALARALGWNAELIAAPDDGLWWRGPLLVLTAFANGFAEEVVVVGYLITRLRQLGVGGGGALAASAALRGGYHLYQGVGGGLGNLAMGVVFGRWYQVTGRLWPLVIAHGVIDAVAFVGYAALSAAGATPFG